MADQLADKQSLVLEMSVDPLFQSARTIAELSAWRLTIET
jgi:hypothetical protein